MMPHLKNIFDTSDLNISACAVGFCRCCAVGYCDVGVDSKARGVADFDA